MHASEPFAPCARWWCCRLFPALSSAQEKLTLGIPGIPAIFGTSIALVADKEGFFKKRGVDVTVRQFETGAFASRAAASGEIDAALPPTPLVVSQISNTDVPLVGIWGMENPDWLIGSTDPSNDCASMKGRRSAWIRWAVRGRSRSRPCSSAAAR